MTGTAVGRTAGRPAGSVTGSGTATGRMTGRVTRLLCLTALLVVSTVMVVGAQGGIGRDLTPEEIAALNTDYDGRFIFARVKFTPGVGSGRGGRGWGRRRDVKWDHDYPRAERHLGEIVRALTMIDPYLDGGNIVEQGSPELFYYPWAYLCEPGFWTATDEEMDNLRDYLYKGGFLVVDDFFRDHWYNFEQQMQRLLPDHRLVELDASHPIFHVFFEIEDLRVLGRNSRGAWPTYYGVFEDNDPDERLMVIVNYDNDIGDWWEWSDQAYTPIDLSNEAYKLGINYIIYSMTH
jgi:hypothetical protein